jgi:hypothetical protein
MVTKRTKEDLSKNESPLLTQHPWKVIGISRASWFRLENRPHPIRLQGITCRRWRIKDLVEYINELPFNKMPAKPVGGFKKDS